MAEDIEKLWPKVNNAKKAHSDWRLYMTFLMKASLVTKKRVKLSKKDHEVYLLVPMLKQMAEENITLRESDLVHRSITQHYVTILWDILRENSLEANKGKQKQNEAVREALWFHEPNIWDCIFRALDIKAEE